MTEKTEEKKPEAVQEIPILPEEWGNRAYREIEKLLSEIRQLKAKGEEHPGMTADEMVRAMEKDLLLIASHQEIYRRWHINRNLVHHIRKQHKNMSDEYFCSHCRKTRDDVMQAMSEVADYAWVRPDTRAMVKLGNVTCMTREQFIGFRAQLEEQVGHELKNLKCGHSKQNTNMRMVLLDNGLTCLDCLMQQLKKTHPR